MMLVELIRTYLGLALSPSNAGIPRNRRLPIGLRIALARDFLQNRRAAIAASHIQLRPVATLDRSTSVSDYREYRQIVAAAASDDTAFSLFRSHHQYFPILEHVSRKLGHTYLEVLSQRSNLPEDWAKRLAILNDVGRPQVWTYPKIGVFSPTVLRYVKVFSDLHHLFGPVTDMRCSEIGIGFGGQAAVLDLLGGAKEFRLYDLPPVLDLATKFLRKIGTASPTKFLDGTNPRFEGPTDLLISNYAFSELTRAVQMQYLETTILEASRGYVTWNSLSVDGFTPMELLGLIPGSRIINENPKTGKDNVILIWGTERDLPQV